MSKPESRSTASIKPADVRIAAMNLLARREHSRRELSQKLLRRFADESIIEQEIARLAAENLQSDERYTHSFVRQRIARGQGPLRITADARQRGICINHLKVAIDENAPDWHELAREVMLKKFGHAEALDAKSKARRVRFMQYRGFCMAHFAALLDL